MLFSSSSFSFLLLLLILYFLILRTVTLMAMDEVFRGFVIQARDAADGSLIGSFDTMQSGLVQTLNCGDPGQDSTVGCIYALSLYTGAISCLANADRTLSLTQVTHTSNVNKTLVNVTWTAPNSTGVVEIRYGTIISYLSHHVLLYMSYS